MAEPFLGQVMLFGGNYAPRGWAFCQGQSLPIQQNAALFSLLGTTYGGDGVSSFNLPDLRGRVPVGFGQGTGLQNNYQLGQSTGAENVTLTTAQMPAHSHNVNADASGGSVASPSGANLAEAGSGRSAVPSYTSGTPAAPVQLSTNTIASQGGGQPFSTVQPVLGMNYIIALQGIFPSRN